MNQNLNIGPSSLQPDYLSAGDNVVQLQTLSNLLRTQVILDLPVDAGLAFLIKTFQNQMNDNATFVDNQFLPDFIYLIAVSDNFYSLWKAASAMIPALIKSSVSNSDDKKKSSDLISVLANQSGLLNQKAKNVAANLTVIKNELDKTNTSFNTALETAISALGSSATAFSTTIDDLQAAITKNINDIVEGANKVGAATSELLIGFITTIEGASSDEGGKGKSPSTDFVVNSIKGATEGVAETAQARADLNANNDKLAIAFQGLAKADALIAVAKVVKVQNNLFANSLSDTLTSIQKIATTWGNTPALPPATGISLSFLDFSESISAISSKGDADKLINIIEYVKGDWDAFNSQLNYLKDRLTHIS